MASKPRILTTCLALCAAGALHAEQGPAFSSLSAEQQQAVRAAVAPPPPAERTGPYSTPMYYNMYKGYTYDGTMDVGPEGRTYDKSGEAGPDWGSWTLDRNRLDWQEAMIEDWVELGLNNVHLNIYPPDGKLELTDEYIEWLEGFIALCDEHGLRIGVRLDALGGYEAWEMHPNNPENQIEQYKPFVRQVASLLKGHALYYVLGDELTLHEPEDGMDPKLWTPDIYLDYFKRVSAEIKRVDPEVVVSMFAPSSGQWFNVIYLLKAGYAEHGDAVGINHYDYNTFVDFYNEAQSLAPGLKFLSNGVGYTSSPTEDRYPEADPYSMHKTEEAHAATIARTMFACWDLRLDTAPYYISLRNWVIDGRVYPRWFGFFGFEDYVIEDDRLTVKRYPGWYAFQTVAHTFYNRDEFKEPAFEVAASEPIEMLKAYEHDTGGATELLLMLWNNSADEIETTVTLASDKYGYATEVELLDMTRWSDVPYRVTDDGVAIDVKVGLTPRIIRLVDRDAIE